ncbi:hypothetical protein GJV26_08025 [Massilia dura]|uniref:Uncharacterized protein n=1 Tax=Pseudoduganella dura TaxID=321982 RepID=A0A6I3XL13_9BURK|nr:hypothetical protein [Pseudoduganella dura]MUI12415.1 hypothetical protein [Pseudoduganella dura]GGX85158.1 hypothetical protein GCM10007386_14940 [Pseudoduganella dura]
MNKRSTVATLFISTALLAGCGDSKDAKLSEMNEPEIAKELQEELTPEERKLLQTYVIKHTMKNDIDYKMTVEDAIDAQREENEEIAKIQKRAAEVANEIR